MIHEFVRSVLLQLPPSKPEGLAPWEAGKSAFSPRCESICQRSIENFPYGRERVPVDVPLGMHLFCLEKFEGTYGHKEHEPKQASRLGS